MSSKKIKSPQKRLKGVKRLKRLVTTLEVLFALLLIAVGIILYVPNVKAAVIKEVATTTIGKKIISWFGSEAYDNSIFDTEFDESKIATNDLKYKYSQEYTNFVMFGVDSRNGEVDASNSDSILVVSIHNTTGEVKMVSIYRDCLLGIYGNDGSLYNYFKINSAYANGGPEAAINTINKNLDLDITDYVTLNFAGVAEVIDTLGGIRVDLTEDELQQLNYHLSSTISSTGEKAKKVKKSGKNIKLNGIQAATYCRIRKATFYDPDTGEAVSNDFGRAARQRSVIMKLVDKAKKAGISQLQQMVSTVMNTDTDEKRIISTSFSFDEIVNLIPVIFDFKLSGSQGFPSTLTTGTIGGASYVIPATLSSNVSELHKFLFDEEEYEPTITVNEASNYVSGFTGITQYSSSYNPTTENEKKEEETTQEENYDYDDKGKSEFY